MTFMFYHLRGNLIRAVAAAANANVVPVAEFEAPDQEQSEGAAEAPISLRASANEIAASLAGEEYLSPDEILMKKELSRVSAQACESLDPLEREIVQRIFIQEEQLMDIAHSLGYSRCHISRVKKKALDTLQENLSGYVEPVNSEEEAPASELEVSSLPRRKRLRARKFDRVHELQVAERDAA
jgi:RNA polymerase sigma factor (sigma-70 family)